MSLNGPTAQYIIVQDNKSCQSSFPFVLINSIVIFLIAHYNAGPIGRPMCVHEKSMHAYHICVQQWHLNNHHCEMRIFIINI